MLDTERKKLFDPKREYLNIGISEGGVVYGIIPVMWESTAGAFNMKTPDVFIAPEDLSDEAVMDRIYSLTVQGLYIYTPLEDYGFISRLTDLWDIHIEGAENMKSLDFLSEMHDCSMLFLAHAHLSDIDTVYKVKEADRGIVQAFRYLGLYDCRVERPTECSNPKCYFTELLVWSRPENRERDMEIWQSASALTKKYYPIEPKER